MGNVDIVGILLQNGALVDAATKDQYTALHIAAKEGQEEVAAVLLDNGAKLTSTTKVSFSLLPVSLLYSLRSVFSFSTSSFYLLILYFFILSSHSFLYCCSPFFLLLLLQSHRKDSLLFIWLQSMVTSKLLDSFWQKKLQSMHQERYEKQYRVIGTRCTYIFSILFIWCHKNCTYLICLCL